MKTLKNKVIVIVGATGGIGSVFAKLFYDEEATVVLSSRTVEKLIVLQKTLGEKRTDVFPSDASKQEDVQKLFEAIKEKFGRIDAVIIVAGSWKQLSIDNSLNEAVSLSEDHYRGLFLPSFISGFVAQKFFRQQGYGLIVNISSHAAVRPELQGNLTYGPMKAASRHFMLAMRNELKGTGVRVVDIQPAIVNTLENKGLDTEEKRKAAVQPEEIAKWVIKHFDDPNISAEKLFDSTVVL